MYLTKNTRFYFSMKPQLRTEEGGTNSPVRLQNGGFYSAYFRVTSQVRTKEGGQGSVVEGLSSVVPSSLLLSSLELSDTKVHDP